MWIITTFYNIIIKSCLFYSELKSYMTITGRLHFASLTWPKLDSYSLHQTERKVMSSTRRPGGSTSSTWEREVRAGVQHQLHLLPEELPVQGRGQGRAVGVELALGEGGQGQGQGKYAKVV